MNDNIRKFIGSRKVWACFVGAIALYIMPEAKEHIIAIIGIYCGANVAQKFTTAHKEFMRAKRSSEGVMETITDLSDWSVNENKS